MKKRIKNKAKARYVPLGCLRVLMAEEPIFPPMEKGPADLRVEMENVLDGARRTLRDAGELTATVILYTADKKLFLIPDLGDDDDKTMARAAVKALMEKHQAKAAILIGEAWTIPPGMISREDPRREEALVAAAKNRREHLVVKQKFHRLEAGKLFFEPAEVIHLDKDSSQLDAWLGNYQF